MEKKLIITITDSEEDISFSVISKNGHFKHHEMIGILEILKDRLLAIKSKNWEKTEFKKD